MPNWQRIEKAPKGIGPLLLRAGSGMLDGAYVGMQADNGRWYFDSQHEVRPTHFCLIPAFDADDEAAG